MPTSLDDRHYRRLARSRRARAHARAHPRRPDLWGLAQALADVADDKVRELRAHAAREQLEVMALFSGLGLTLSFALLRLLFG